MASAKVRDTFGRWRKQVAQPCVGSGSAVFIGAIVPYERGVLKSPDARNGGD
jgi:hypothetical protein